MRPAAATAVAVLAGLLLAGCGRLDELLYEPTQTAESWLTIQPFARVALFGREVVLVQPTTSAIVYGLGLLAVVVGARFLWRRRGERSRLWWGAALVLWGVGALLAGTSYEAFSYAIKCEGRPACVWTSGWEIGYLLVSVASFDAIALAVAYSCALGRARRALSAYALLNLVLYLVVVAVGVGLANRFLISFELLLVFVAPTVAWCFALNAVRYRRERLPLDRALLGAWIGLALTIAAYLGYLAAGLTETLWDTGVWFSANDVLHLGLIAWMLYLAVVLDPLVVDARPGDRVDAAAT
jgi:hypothetical protein